MTKENNLSSYVLKELQLDLVSVFHRVSRTPCSLKYDLFVLVAIDLVFQRATLPLPLTLSLPKMRGHIPMIS